MTSALAAGRRVAPALPRFASLPLAGLCLLALPFARAASAQTTAPPVSTGATTASTGNASPGAASPDTADASGGGAPPFQGSLSLDIDVIAQRLDQARTQIQPSLGATTYEFSRPSIENQPQGDNTPFNQLLLQAPGVAQDSFGQLHVRGDHANLQFRLNGVELPEGINVFGQALETRLANSVALITGALPAQYGFRTAGIIDIQTKTGTLDPGGSMTMYGGSQGTLQPSAEWGGRVGQLDYYVTGEYLTDGIGVENPTSSFAPLHDATEQGRGFAYLSGIIDPTTRLSAIIGTSRSQFQIPNNPNQSTNGLTVNAVSNFDSRNLNENQREITDYSILALQKHVDDIDAQLSVFNRYSSVYFSPDPLGDILFNGIAQNAYRRSIATGSQLDASWRVSADHTLRAGYLVQGERSTASTVSDVLPIDASGNQTSEQPISITDQGGKTGWLYGVYLQDEWKIVPTVTVNFGGRFDLVDEYAHEQQGSPRANVVWQPTDATTLHVGYARYFTPPPFELVAPTTIALFANTSAEPATTQDSTVKSERDNYFDVGGTQIVIPGLKVGLDAYYKRAHDLIDEGQFGAPIILTPFNYQNGIVKGAEFTTSYDIDNWSLYGNFAVSEALGKNIISGQFNFSPDDLAYIAGHYIHLDHDQTYTGSAGVAYTFPWKMRASADLIYGSGLRADSDHPNGNSLPDYAQVNVSLVQKIDTGFLKGLEARLDIINLFDSIYEIRTGTGVGVGAPQYGPRRTILAGMTKRF
ncbi:MAG: TonB-dependent receptor [Alphaproteobacteria bacterium]|nr:TonB-dependent receptor [Alphaproteobacteria bacterium]